jgi:hypothetical protein
MPSFSHCDVTICERLQVCGHHALDQDFHASPVFLGRWVCPFQGKERMAVFGPWALPTAEVGAALWAEMRPDMPLLRSFGCSDLVFYKHGAPTELRGNRPVIGNLFLAIRFSDFTPRTGLFMHSCAVCVLALWGAQIKTGL